ncbi:HNH endonuclease [Flavobacterium johnsoniae]|uniref:HNH endonuclease n=1 Tax=Flavobacterium johnsoniae TaxID=986 RepID=UPI0025B152CE|nr:HNH endonuclease signature motif containing protein [Flavobacterium johnsoniae]WJS96992.1 HNH endonuclease [Flavobacterium johnsoniae]
MGYLSIDNSLELIGNCNLIYNKKSIKIYSTKDNESFLIKFSKLYEDGISYWFGITPKSIKTSKEQNVDFFCFTLGYEGIIKLPVKILNEYIKTADFSFNNLKNEIKHYHIRIKFDTEIILYNSRKEIIITDYLLYDENLINIDLQSTDLEKIKKQAEDFSDYTQQYYLSEKKTKYRKESKAQKTRIAILENNTCQICNFSCGYINNKGNKSWIIEIDHIIDKGQGGGETINNLWVLCPNCHSKKTRGIITIDTEKKIVLENGKIIQFNDNHLGWNK